MKKSLIFCAALLASAFAFQSCEHLVTTLTSMLLMVLLLCLQVL